MYSIIRTKWLFVLLFFLVPWAHARAGDVTPVSNIHIRKILSTLSPTMIPNSPEKVFTVLMRSRIQTQILIKDYIYINNQVALSRARSESRAIRKEVTRDMLFLSSAFKDPSLSSLMHIINANMERIESLMRMPYTPQNLAVILYNGSMVSDGLLQVAKAIYRQHDDHGMYRLDELRMALIDVAEAYLYVHDDLKKITRGIPGVKPSLARFQKTFARLDSSPSISAKAQRYLIDARHLWQAINTLCSDAQVGDLPSIIFRTTTRLDKELVRYFEESNN
jgi:hypothetical protein